MTEDREFLHNQLIKLGDMMGDGLHYEPDGKWISKEYRRISKILFPEMFPKRDFSFRDNKVAEWCKSHKCDKCGDELKQTKSGALRVVCLNCKTKYQLKTQKRG